MADTDHIDETLSIEREMPVGWSPCDGGLQPSRLEAINDNNARLLSALAVIEEQAHADVYDHSQSSQELLRLDAKVDLLTSLVTRLVFQNQLVPPSTSVNLSYQALRWKGTIAAAVGDSGVFELFVHPAIAVPLQLPVKVVSEGRAEIVGLSRDVQNALEKFLFRQHRREVAARKKQTAGDR